MKRNDLSRIAHALSDPVRLRILDRLAVGRGPACCSPANPEVPAGVCACDIEPLLAGMSQSKLAYHMKVLREARLVRAERRAKWVYYTLNADTLRQFRAALGGRYESAIPVAV